MAQSVKRRISDKGNASVPFASDKLDETSSPIVGSLGQAPEPTPVQSGHADDVLSSPTAIQAEPISVPTDLNASEAGSSPNSDAKLIFGFTLDIEDVQQRTFGDDIADTLRTVQLLVVPSWLSAVVSEVGPLISAMLAIVNRKFSGLLRLLLVAARMLVKSTFPAKTNNNNNSTNIN